MSTGLRRKSAVPKGSNVWDLTDARKRFDDLLAAAAARGPQIIRCEGMHFRVSLDKAGTSPKGRALLGKGGPLDDKDLVND
jgi:hypothetical protein